MIDREELTSQISFISLPFALHIKLFKNTYHLFNSVVITARVSHGDVSLLAAQRRLNVLRPVTGGSAGTDPGAGCRDDTES